ncbi:YkvI family membrane protein [Gudongella sp. SC589]|uniref:YkvI family membrane protein n=1 Tax=Gudongella sp. SC589 TaxID=3385990 RepID=UPI003904C820
MKIKSIKPKEIAMGFTGSLLGAGFVSGQEIMQFFGVFGSYGLIAMPISLTLLYILGCFVMKTARKTGITEFDKIIIRKDIHWLRGFFSGTYLFYLFGTVIIMTAGTGALLNQMWGVPSIIGSGIMAVLLGIVALWEAKGVLWVFSITVPFLIAVGMVTGVFSIILFEPGYIAASPFSGENPLLGNWIFSTVAFVSYNMMGAISILVPISPDVKEERTIHKGMLRGTVQLSIVFICILLPLILFKPVLSDAELPMLALADKINPMLGLIYSILLFTGMFGTALSFLYGAAYRIRKYREYKLKPLIGVLVSVAFMGSLLGFKELIGIVLPISGYIGFFAMIGITRHYLAIRKTGEVG